MADCPVCGKPTAEGSKPFCSQRCADVDLNRWLKGGYVIPGGPGGAPTPSNPSESDPDQD